MAVRPGKEITGGLIRTYTVAAAQSATIGQGLIFAAADDQVQSAGASGLAFCIALETKAAGEKVRVLMLGPAILPVKVGAAGTATRGTPAECVAGGAYTNRTIGGGSVARPVSGIFLQSGVANDEVELMLMPFVGGSA